MRTQDCTDTIHSGPDAAADALARLDRGLPSPADVGQAIWRTLIRWQRRAEYRCKLETMDGRLLDDIGLTRAQAMAEARKPFWRA